jgi:hypothetical protein
VLGEFGSLSGPTNPKAQIGYVSNGQPLGVKFETPKGQTGPTMAVITGMTASTHCSRYPILSFIFLCEGVFFGGVLSFISLFN